jgi:hypothetical protein
MPRNRKAPLEAHRSARMQLQCDATAGALLTLAPAAAVVTSVRKLELADADLLACLPGTRPRTYSHTCHLCFFASLVIKAQACSPSWLLTSTTGPRHPRRRNPWASLTTTPTTIQLLPLPARLSISQSEIALLGASVSWSPANWSPAT